MADDVDLRVEPRAADKSLGELVGEMTEHLSTIFQKEIELVKVELKEDAQKTAKGAGMLGGAAVAGYFALLFLSFALGWLLDEVMHTALAFLIVAVLYGIGAAVLGMKGKEQLGQTEGLPNTKASLKEDAAWARAQKS